jgi:hypothetical protein
MKFIDTQFITGGATQPIKKGTLDLLQQAHQETTSNIFLSEIQSGDVAGLQSPSGFFEWNEFWSLYGCKGGISGGLASVSYGIIWHAGQFYEAPRLVSTVVPSGNVIVGTFTEFPTLSTDADPVTFGGTGGSHNVHINKKIIWSVGGINSGDINYDDLHWYGEWKSATYSSSNLLSANGTFTIANASDYVLKYIQKGRTVTVDFLISNGTTSLSTPYVILRLPLNAPFNGKFKSSMNSMGYINCGGVESSTISTIAGTREIAILRSSGANIPATTGTFRIYGQITAELEGF